MMQRLALTYRLRPGATESYVEAHRAIWPEMKEFLQRSGVKQMTIFLRGDTAFLYADVENLATYQYLESIDPISQRWEALMQRLVDQPFGADETGAFAQLTEVWHFES